MCIDIGNCETGFFGLANKFTRVHIVQQGSHKPICGCHISKQMSFQWCAMGVIRSYVECARCLKIFDRA